MSGVELTLFICSIVTYVTATVAGGILSRRKVALFMLLAGLVLQFASAGVRWYGIGHPPIFGTFEATMAGSWFIILAVVIAYSSTHGHFRILVRTAIPIAVLLVLYGFAFFNTERIPLTISELSLWVDFHALFSWIAFAPLTLAFCLSLVLLWREKNGEGVKGELSGETAGIDANDILDELVFRYINFGFINHSIMFALGAYYSSILYGKWWEWDPAESTWLIAWLGVALYIHLRLFYNWRRKKAAWLYVVVFCTIAFSYWGLVYLPPGSSFHVFDLELKLH